MDINIKSLGSYGGAPPQVGSSAADAAAPKPAPAPDVIFTAPAQEPSKEQVKQAVDSIRKSVESIASNSLNISIDEESGEMIVRITDKETGAVLRQIPSVEALELARSMEKMQGKLLQERA